MPNPCQFGAAPAPGAPLWFRFTAADLVDAFGAAVIGMSIELLDIPLGPIETADFVNWDFEWDFPVAADYATVGIEALGYFTGAYRRFRNLVYAKKWATLAVCKNSVGPRVVDGMRTWAPPSPLVVHVGTVNPARFLWVSDALVDVQRISLHWAGSVPPGAVISFRCYTPQPIVGDSAAFPAWSSTWQSQTGSLSNAQQTATIDLNVDAGFGSSPPATVWFAIIGLSGDPDPTYTVTVDNGPQLPPDPPPALVAPPAGYPAAPDPPACSLESLCADVQHLGDQMRALMAFVQHTNAVLAPLGVEPRGEPVLAAPVDPLVAPGTPDTPLLPLVKPADAVGAVVQCTTVPAALARYGVDPLYFPSLAHVIPVTAQGPMCGIRIERNPQVIADLPQLVTHLVLDPQPGVVAQVQWLHSPR